MKNVSGHNLRIGGWNDDQYMTTISSETSLHKQNEKGYQF